MVQCSIQSHTQKKPSAALMTSRDRQHATGYIRPVEENTREAKGDMEVQVSVHSGKNKT